MVRARNYPYESNIKKKMNKAQITRRNNWSKWRQFLNVRNAGKYNYISRHSHQSLTVMPNVKMLQLTQSPVSQTTRTKRAWARICPNESNIKKKMKKAQITTSNNSGCEQGTALMKWIIEEEAKQSLFFYSLIYLSIYLFIFFYFFIFLFMLHCEQNAEVSW